MVTGILFAVIFVLTVFLGEIVGLLIEARYRKRWRNAAHSIGFGFDARKKRLPSVSRVVLPAVTVQREIPSALIYGESRNALQGNVEDFRVLVTDFTVWDFFNRCPLVFRGVLCAVKHEHIGLPGKVMVVNWRSYLVDGLRVSDSFREFHFPMEGAFSQYFALFGRGGFAPWYFTPDLRDLCVRYRRAMHCLWVTEDEVVILWTDNDPDRLPDLVSMSMNIAYRLSETQREPAVASASV